MLDTNPNTDIWWNQHHTQLAYSGVAECPACKALCRKFSCVVHDCGELRRQPVTPYGGVACRWASPGRGGALPEVFILRGEYRAPRGTLWDTMDGISMVCSCAGTLALTLGTSTVSCYERLYAGQLQFPDFRQTVRTSPVSRTNFRVIRLTEILQFPAELTLDRMLEHPVVNITSLGASA